MSAKPREHQIEVKSKKIRTFEIQRKFKQEQSVFKGWVIPDYKKMIEKDFALTKADTVVDNDTIYGRVIQICIQEVETLLTHFHYLIGRSHYSRIGY